MRNILQISIMSSHEKNFLLLLLFSFLLSSNSVHGLEDQQRKPTTKVVMIGSHSEELRNTLGDINNYAELKHDPRASLPTSFTICVSVLVTTMNLWPFLFSLLRNDGFQSFSAENRQLGD